MSQEAINAYLNDPYNHSLHNFYPIKECNKSEKSVFIGTPITRQDMIKRFDYYWSAFSPEQSWRAFWPQQIMADWYVKSKAIMENKETN